MDDSWDSLAKAVNLYGVDKDHFAEVVAPGFFNDPDMVIELA